jgi:tol-pal system protein YbgF
MERVNHAINARRWLLAALFIPVPALGAPSNEEIALKLSSLEMQTKAILERLERLETAYNNQGLVTLLAQVEGLKSEVRKLRGQLEVHNYTIELTQKRQKDLYVDLDERMNKLASAMREKPVNGTGESSSVPAALAADPMAEAKDYEAALGHYKMGNYPAAINAFQQFLKDHQASSMASNAQFWIGQSHFSAKDFKSAIANQQKLLILYPGSPKAPDAMLNIASSQIELGDLAGARSTLEQLVAKHPGSQAAELAQKRLAILK